MKESIRLHDEATVKQKLVQRIPSHYQLGAAIGRGDCFFDAMAQSLNVLKGSKEYTAKSLRLLCDDYVKSGKHAWVKETIEAQGNNYEQYLVRIPFTIEELEEAEKENTGLKLEDIVWGRPEIEGRIICDITKVKLHVIGVLKQPIHGMDVTEQLVNAQALEPITTIEKGPYDGSDIVHLVNHQNHFVPLLDSKIAQIEKPLTQPAKYSLRMQRKLHGVSIPESLATRAEYVETIRQKIKEGPAADPNYRMLFEKLVDPAYKEEKDFLKKEISEYRINLQAHSSPIIQNYLTWLQKNIPQNEDNTPRMLFSDEKIDLYIRNKDPSELIDLIELNDKNQQSAINASFNSIHEQLKTYYSNNDKYIYRVIRSLTKLPIEKNCFINLSIIEREIQARDEQEKLKVKSYDRAKVYNSYEDIFSAKEKQPIGDIKDLFDYRNGKLPRSLLIIGRAGIGKSTLTQYISYRWATNTLWNDKFDFIFKIKLRNLTKKRYNNFNTSLPNIIANECLSSTDLTGEKREEIISYVEAMLKDESKRMLIILDGLDEFNYKSSPYESTIKELLNKENRKGFYLIATSRPYVNNISHEDFDLQLECVGFSTADIQNYIKLEEVKVNKEAQSEIQVFLEKNPAIHSVVHVPIMLDMLCAIWDKNLPTVKDSMTMTEFYNKLIQKLWESYNTRQEELYSKIDCEEIIKRKNRAKIFLNALAFNAMELDQVMLDADLVCNTIKDIYKCDSEDVKLKISELLEPGLLYSPNYTEDTYDSCNYYFPHLTFQEYFAANYFAEKIKSNNEEITKFISEFKYHPRYEIVWWFVSGLLKNIEKELQNFFEMLSCDPKDKLGLYDILLTIRCLSECNKDLNDSQKVVLKQWFVFSIKNINSEIRNFITETFKYSLNIYNKIKKELFFDSLQQNTNLLRAKSFLFYLEKFIRFDKTIIDFLKPFIKHEHEHFRHSIACCLLENGVYEAEVINLVLNGLKSDFLRHFSIKVLENIHLTPEIIEGLIIDLGELLISRREQEAIAILAVLTKIEQIPLNAKKLLIEILQAKERMVMTRVSAALNLIIFFPPDEKLIKILLAFISEAITYLESQKIPQALFSIYNKIYSESWDFLNSLDDFIEKFKKIIAEPDIQICTNIYKEIQETSKASLSQSKIKNKRIELKKYRKIYPVQETSRDFYNLSIDEKNKVVESSAENILMGSFQYADIYILKELAVNNDKVIKAFKCLLSSEFIDNIETAIDGLINIRYFDVEIFNKLMEILIKHSSDERYDHFLSNLQEDISFFIDISNTKSEYLLTVLLNFNELEDDNKKRLLSAILRNFDLTEFLGKINVNDKDYLHALLRSTPLSSLLLHTLTNGRNIYYEVIRDKLIEHKLAIYITENNQLCFHEGGDIKYFQGKIVTIKNLCNYLEKSLNPIKKEIPSKSRKYFINSIKSNDIPISENNNNQLSRSSAHALKPVKTPIQQHRQNKNNVNLNQSPNNNDPIYRKNNKQSIKVRKLKDERKGIKREEIKEKSVPPANIEPKMPLYQKDSEITNMPLDQDNSIKLSTIQRATFFGEQKMKRLSLQAEIVTEKEFNQAITEKVHNGNTELNKNTLNDYIQPEDLDYSQVKDDNTRKLL